MAAECLMSCDVSKVGESTQCENLGYGGLSKWCLST